MALIYNAYPDRKVSSIGVFSKCSLKFILSFAAILFFSLSGYSQEIDTLARDTIIKNQDTLVKQDSLKKVNPVNYIDFSNKIFRDNIKTVLFHREGWDLSPPLLKLNQGEHLMLSFDDLDADGKQYSFTIVHCDADWKPSDLDQYQYIDGYYDDYLDQFSFSANTFVPYTHYKLEFPTEDMKPKISGNYYLKIYLDDPDSLYFTRRFMVLTQKVNVKGTIKQATQIDDRNYKQEVDFEILTGNYQIVNPYRDLKVIITQNGRWDNAISTLKPKMVVSNKIDYNYDYENVFDGGNEFRKVDIKSLNYYTENIQKIEYTTDGYDVFLIPAQKKTFKVYKTVEDINGKMKIKTEDRSDSDIQSEYVNVHFFLPFPGPLFDGSIYIIGALTDWRYSNMSKMEYDYTKKGYQKTLLLKQGYYEYQYIIRYDNEKTGDVSLIEGNHWETENDYTIYVYNREPGNFYDSLIGMAQLNSRSK